MVLTLGTLGKERFCAFALSFVEVNKRHMQRNQQKLTHHIAVLMKLVPFSHPLCWPKGFSSVCVIHGIVLHREPTLSSVPLASFTTKKSENRVFWISGTIGFSYIHNQRTTSTS